MRLPNMAGRKDCDEYIKRELEHCLIKVCRLSEVEAYKLKNESEVPYSLYGELGLGDFTFKRAWYYYIVNGRVPIALAETIYKDPACIQDVRAGGDCGAIPPKEHAKWYDGRTKRTILKLKEKEECECYLKTDSKIMQEIAKKILNESDFAEDPSAVGEGFVDLYHIDTEVGLRVFSDCLRKHFKW
jgi:hypothetical protein